jgi:hypothetical protein
VSDGRWTISFPASYSCYIGGTAITSPTTIDLSYPRLITLTSTTAKTGKINLGSNGTTAAALSQMSFSDIMIMPVQITATEAAAAAASYYGQASIKVTDTIATTGTSSGGRVGYASATWQTVVS